ncbi:hypothetical protein D6D06_01795 [Aureobasidium pullulans]|nr:hypothetical protein D6D06_01795 [Aureobasidium pullulans]
MLLSYNTAWPYEVYILILPLFLVLRSLYVNIPSNNTKMSYQVEVPTADTIVVVSTDRKYKLHSAQLVQCSSRFAEMLQTAGPNLSREGLKQGTRYMLCLQDFDETSTRPIKPVFRRIPIDKDGKPTKKVTMMHEGDKGYRFRPSLFSDYDRLLRSIANQPIVLNDKSIETVLPDAMGLIEVAEYLGSVIENYLLARGQDFFKAISIDPIIWIDVAYRIESKVMFKEALIHLVGKYNLLLSTPPTAAILRRNPKARSMLDQLNVELRDLVESKHEIIKKQCQQIEVAISTHYPSGLQKSEVTGRADRDGIGRQEYGRDVFSWIGVALYRHWWGQTLANDGTHNNQFGGQDIYARLHKGGSAYLTRELTAGFNTHFPMSVKGKSVLANNLDIIKVGVSAIVAPLMVNESQLDIASSPIKWLTCTKVVGADYLWEPEPEPELEPELEPEVESYSGKGKRRAEEAFDDEDEEAEEADDEEDEET